MAKKVNVEKKSLCLPKILDAMETYLINDDHNFHNQLFMVYCNSCQAITSVGGNYTIFSGRDCNGEHYETVKSPEECTKCRTRNFIKISKYDMTDLYEMYKDRTSEIIIGGIENGLKNMKFPSLYNAELPKVVKIWGRFSEKEKKRQINSLLSLQRKIKESRENIKSLEEVLI